MKKQILPLLSGILLLIIVCSFGLIICKQNRQIIVINQKLNSLSNKNNTNENSIYPNKKTEDESSKVKKDVFSLEYSLRNLNDENDTFKRIMNELSEKNGLKTTQHFILGGLKTDVSLTFPEPAYFVQQEVSADYLDQGYTATFSLYPHLKFSIGNTEKASASECITSGGKKVIFSGIEFCMTKVEDAAMGKSYDTTVYTAEYKGNPFSIEFVSEYSFNVPTPETEEDYKTAQKNIEKLIPEIMKTIKIKPFEQVE